MKKILIVSLVAVSLVAVRIPRAVAWDANSTIEEIFEESKAERQKESHFWERQAEKEQEFQDRLQERRARDCYLSRCRDDDDDYLGELQNRNSEDRDPVNELMDDLQQDDPWR